MCKVSCQLKFCTCSRNAINKNAYWTLYRYHDDQAISVMGDLILPIPLDPGTDNFNREVLLSRVNEKEAWDFNLNPSPNDRLAVTINGQQGGNYGYVTYGFEYDAYQKKWLEREFEPFEWQSKHVVGESGQIKI